MIAAFTPSVSLCPRWNRRAPGLCAVIAASGAPRSGASEIHRSRYGPVVVQLGADTQLVLDPLLDLGRDIGVVTEELAGILLALSELVAFVGVPGTRLPDDALLHT